MENNKELLKRIETKIVELENIKITLKEKFIGIDDVIDRVINDLSLWYLTPELQFRPLIISLWGITGVGKTDLVRTLVNLLNFNDKFIEIQLDVKNYYHKTIESYFDSSGIDTNEPSILLLDEIQRYRTIDEQGNMVINDYYNDIWALLSDGKFVNNAERKTQLMEMMFDKLYYKERDDNDGDEVQIPKNKSTTPLKKEKKVEYKYKTSYWSASNFKRLLKLDMSVDEIMKMSVEEQMNFMEKRLKDPDINEGKSYEKLLIFISGNLDDAFKFSNNTDDSERDADIYHEHSKKVSIVDIKDSLRNQFKPEQIARFGNNHIIYPSLSKDSYHKIIRQNANKILKNIKEKNGITINITDSVYDVIYRNGVYPAQGVRPIISSVNILLSNSLPYFMYYALTHNVNTINIEIENDLIVSTINGNKYSKKLNLDIDKIRNNKTIDEITLISVHEIGHALLYGHFFGIAPKQINVNSSSSFHDGFIINHQSEQNKNFIMNMVVITLGGMVAEEIVFGNDMVSAGAESDIESATTYVGNYIRKYGMHTTIGNISRERAVGQGQESIVDLNQSNIEIEKLLKNLKAKTKAIIISHSALYKKLVTETIKNRGITPEQFAEICKSNGLNIDVIGYDGRIEHGYDKLFNDFLNKNCNTL